MHIYNLEEKANLLIEIGERLQKLELGVLPTDTIYGLSTVADDDDALRKIFRAKGRTSPCSVIAPSKDWALEQVPTHFHKKLSALWEEYGARTTLLFPLAPNNTIAASNTSSGLIGFRRSNGWIAELASLIQRPIASTSVNPSGQAHATSIDTISTQLIPSIDFALDVGSLKAQASTLIHAYTDALKVERR